jgi:hypothetical protein
MAEVPHQSRAELEPANVLYGQQVMVIQGHPIEADLHANAVLFDSKVLVLVETLVIALNLRAIIAVPHKQLLISCRNPMVVRDGLLDSVIVCTAKSAVGTLDEVWQEALRDEFGFEGCEGIPLQLFGQLLGAPNVHPDFEFVDDSVWKELGQDANVFGGCVMYRQSARKLPWPDRFPVERGQWCFGEALEGDVVDACSEFEVTEIEGRGSSHFVLSFCPAGCR